jgi:hypothetical protein
MVSLAIIMDRIFANCPMKANSTAQKGNNEAFSYDGWWETVPVPQLCGIADQSRCHR